MKHNWMITLTLIILFFVSQVVGLVVVDSYFEKSEEKEWKSLPSILGVDVERPEISPKLSIVYMTVAIILGTVLILFIVSFKRVFIWKLWFLLSVILCLQISLAAFLNEIFALFLALFFGFWKVFRSNFFVHNLTELFIYGGLAVIFVPMLNPFYAIILLFLLSCYDMYAVWKSKHMIKMAKFQTKAGIFAGFLIPYYKKKEDKSKKVNLEKKRTAVLGGGDVGFPLIFTGTVLVKYGLFSALIVTIFSTFALFILLFLSKKDRFYPAMPFLSAGCFLGFAIVKILNWIL
jgi:presenilin-like A22 family membrane protease